MTRWRRAFIPGGTFFFTVVTERRQPILTTPPGRALLGTVMRECQQRWPFEVVAIVLLPNHLHAILRLPSQDDDYTKGVKKGARLDKEPTSESRRRGKG